MLEIKRTTSDHIDFQKLVVSLDKDLALKNGEDNDFFVQFNKIDALKYVVLAYLNNKVAGCGAIKHFDDDTVEVKRMFVSPECRGSGIASKIINELEVWATELGYKKCVLETGDKMVEAINLYKKCGYQVISNYGQYKDVESSICFEKSL